MHGYSISIYYARALTLQPKSAQVVPLLTMPVLLMTTTDLLYSLRLREQSSVSSHNGDKPVPRSDHPPLISLD